MDITNLIKRYQNLLIVQYADKPKAKQFISELVKLYLADGFVFDLYDAYNIDTAIGNQLDVIGKYVGIDRNYQEDLNANKFFAFATEGYTDYTNVVGFLTENDYDISNFGFLQEIDIYGNQSQLNDDAYRVAIYFKIMQNYSNASYHDITENIYKVFGNAIYPQTMYQMDIYYFVTNQYKPIMKFLAQKKVLPKPLGINLTNIIVSDIPFFAFATEGYTDYTNVVGFATESDYNKLNAEFLSEQNNFINLN